MNNTTEKQSVIRFIDRCIALGNNAMRCGKSSEGSSWYFRALRAAKHSNNVAKQREISGYLITLI